MNINQAVRGLTPTEVLISNLCDGKRSKEEISKELESKMKVSSENSHKKFELCLEVLKKRDLIAF